MARPLRIEYPGAWYHVMNRGRRKENIFCSDGDRRLFIELAGDCVKLFGLEIHAYSLMPNHYHLLVKTPLANLSRAMRHLNGVYTQKINKRYKHEGSLFKGRYKSIIVEEDPYLLELVRYIHRNPLKGKIAEDIKEHKWTSHRAYMLKGEGPKWLTKNTVLGRFGTHENTAKRRLDALVKQEVPKDLEKILEMVKWPLMLGGEGFKKKIKNLVEGKKIEAREVPQRKETEIEISCREVADILINRLDGWDKQVLKSSKVRSVVEKRRKFAYLCREELKIPCRDICNTLGGISFAAVSNYCKWVKDQISADKKFAKEIAELARITKEKLNIEY